MTGSRYYGRVLVLYSVPVEKFACSAKPNNSKTSAISEMENRKPDSRISNQRNICDASLVPTAVASNRKTEMTLAEAAERESKLSRELEELEVWRLHTLTISKQSQSVRMGNSIGRWSLRRILEYGEQDKRVEDEGHE